MFKRLFSYFRPHMRLFVLDLVCAFLVGLTDEFMPLIVRNIINEYVPKQSWALMVKWSIALAVIYVIKFCLNMIITYWGHVFGIRVQADMRRDIFRHIEKLPISFFDDNKTGALMSRITNDLQEVSEMSHHGPENLFISVVMLGVSAYMLGHINGRLTLIVYSCLPIALLFVILIRKGQMEAFTRNRREIAGINGETETSIAGVRVTRAFDGAEQEYLKFDRANARYVGARKIAYMYLALFHSGMTFFTDIMYVVVVLVGGKMFFHGSGVKRFEEIMNLPLEQDEEGAVDAGILKGDIVFDHVSFHYRNHDTDGPMVIRDMNLHIAEQETLGLVGPSGGGKTTLCNLIPRFYEIDSGEIRIDGIDIRHMTRESLRRNIGIVAQDIFLFHGTIRENISYGNPDADDAMIIDAAKKAGIHDDIMAMKDGYDTNVGERGVHLSGGQRQRISIARIFLKNPRILILDEATSALDNATEMLIQQSLDELSKGRTVIVVAHRLSTLRNADRIAVITGEGIAEEGTKEELLEKDGIYSQLYKYQFENA